MAITLQEQDLKPIEDRYRLDVISVQAREDIAIATIRELGGKATYENLRKKLLWAYQSDAVVVAVLKTIDRLRSFTLVEYDGKKQIFRINSNYQQPKDSQKIETSGISLGTVPTIANMHICCKCGNSIENIEVVKFFKLSGDSSKPYRGTLADWHQSHATCFDLSFKQVGNRVRVRIKSSKPKKKPFTFNPKVLGTIRIGQRKRCPRCGQDGKIGLHSSGKYLYHFGAAHTNCYLGRISDFELA